MSSLISFNSSESMSFLALPAVFFARYFDHIHRIVNMWMILKQKISDELSAYDIKINTSITAEITKIKNEINTKIGKEFKSSEWTLIGFLRWRSQFTDFSNTQLEHSAWKTLLRNIASSVYEESARLKVEELLSSFKDATVYCWTHLVGSLSQTKSLGRMPLSIAGLHWWSLSQKPMDSPCACPGDKYSTIVQDFWSEHRISGLEHRLLSVATETRLRMAISDLKYVAGKSEEETLHSNMVGERRCQILKGELQSKRKASSSVTDVDALISTKKKKPDSELDNDDEEISKDKFQLTNIDKLERGENLRFSANCEEILSFHSIMYIDLARMKVPSYISINEHSWRSSVRQADQPNPPNFFRDIMDNYEKVINDIDELRYKFYETWGRYRDHVIYSDEERRIFETTQIVARSLANGQSPSSKEHRMTYGRPQGKKPDMVICRILEKGEREESCFVEAKHFSISRNSDIGGYDIYKIAILCQGGINKMMSLRENKSGQAFGAHICGGFLHLCMMDLVYDGIYRFFVLSEIKLAQDLSEFNLCRIDSFYSNINSHNESGSPGSPPRKSFSRRPVITPKAPKNGIPVVGLTEQKTGKKGVSRD
ncbi:10637_t:CDS:10 [Funneliformis caledonium]|uniref:10637_t:CDS:1 n=1 Tax=Funneliformis caledonium TaxID=1117310 RepID=A0A9N9B4L3_9GLOM|nr:10637_t:CDS:10 [Funneliformis caledonium]